MVDDTKRGHPVQGGHSVWFSARDGLRIHVRVYKPVSASTGDVVCLPGLSRNSRDFDLLASALANHAKHPKTVYCFDFRGRGLSDHDSDWHNYNILKEAEDVIDGLTAFDIEHAGFVGTSRGGLVTMVLTALRPGTLSRVVFNDIGPVMEGDGLTQIRLYLQRLPKPRDWAEARSIQKSVMEKSFTAMGENDWVREAWCRYRDINGEIRPDHDPQLVKTLTGLDLEARLPTMWPQFTGLRKVPLLVLRGQNSTLLRPSTLERMHAAHPTMQSLEIANQGHAPLLTGEDTIGPISEFLTGRHR